MSTFHKMLPFGHQRASSHGSHLLAFFLNRLREHFTDVLHIFRHELVKVVKDEGVLMFLVVVPLGYPLLYSWIYNNESLHETPVVVVDQSHSALSRQFINDCDA